jgi:uncharacterized membrane-anchored protein
MKDIFAFLRGEQVMKKIAFMFILIFIFICSACTFHIPYDYEDWADYDYRVMLEVEPDDTDVLLDGRFIGLAYEFSTPQSALRLSSRNHDLVLKRRGYVERKINLYKYRSRLIKINVKMAKQKPYEPKVKRKDVEEKKVTKTKPEYKPKTEVEKPVPDKDEPTAVKSIKVDMEILPPESSIYLNGKFWGISPKDGLIKNLRLKPGKYTIDVMKPGYKSVTKTVNVKDEEISVTIKLEK